MSPGEAKQRFPGVVVDAWRALSSVFPVRVTRSWADRVISADDPLGLQVFPHPSELTSDVSDIADPVGEEQRMPVPWVVQKHADRALLLVTRRCHVHCRYCFRRDLDGPSDPSTEEMETAVSYLRQSGVHEVILSGGDPLILRTEKLAEIIDALHSDVRLIRIHSRAPITFPDRVDDALVAMLQQRQPVWMVVHINHPDELSDEVCQGLARLVDGGVPVLNQSVLLRGVNDDPEVLISLSRRLLELRVRPYYLHHPDAVPGGGRFRVSLEEGLAIHDALRKRLSGIALPQYVIDPPDGTGKVPVAEWVARPVR